MLQYRTTGYKGYGIQYSPFFDNKLAVATASNYGLVGNGKLFILNIEPTGAIGHEISWETQDGLFDVSWSEIHENHVVVASGDGSIKLFDTKVGKFPVQNWHEHGKEVFSVNWNMIDKSSFVSSSWDGTVKVWNVNNPRSLLSLNSKTDYTTKTSPNNPPMSHQPNHQNNTSECIYTAQFSPHSPSTIVSCNGLSHLQIWDIRSPQPLQMDFVSHGGLETLSCDWNKYRPNVVASASTDKSIRIWDLRMINNVNQLSHSPLKSFHTRGPTPMNELLGHEFAIRKVQWSPHNSQDLLSTSYDMTARVWADLSNDQARFLHCPPGSMKGVMHRHKEFVIGCDYSLWGEPGWAATTGWDEMVYVWDTKRV